MTTIAWDKKTLAADGANWVGDTLVNNSCKKINLIDINGDDGVYEILCKRILAFAASGLTSADIDILYALKHGITNCTKFDKDLYFACIAINEDLNCFYLVKGKGEERIDITLFDGCFAVGSGQDFALAAMHCGRDAVQAVEVAKQFDRGTSGEITYYNLRNAYDKHR